MKKRKVGVCIWKFDSQYDYYNTSCDNLFEFSADGPNENKFLYCPYCGNKLEVKPD